jgi:hypothetical protein
MSKKIIPLLAGSLLLNCVAFYFLVLGEQRIVPSITQVKPVNQVTLSEASSGVYRDDDDVLYVRGELTTEIGAQTIQALQEGVSRIVLDISGGEIGQAIRVSEMIAIYTKPIDIISCAGACLAIAIPSLNSTSKSLEELNFHFNDSVSQYERMFLIDYLKMKKIDPRLLQIIENIQN